MSRRLLRLYDGQPTLAMHTNLVQKLPLVLNTCHVERPLRVAVGIADSTQPGDDSESEQQNLQLPGETSHWWCRSTP